MREAREIARHLIRIGYSAESPEESVLICPLRLQKFLYSCQGYSLALLNRPLFADGIEAWPYGPVVPAVYESFRGIRDGITPERAGEPTQSLTESEIGLIQMVWSEFARYTPRQLVDKTHAEPAWRDARAGLDEAAPSHNPLSLTTMGKHFRETAGRAAGRSPFPTPDPAEVWRADEDFDASSGRGTPLAEVLARPRAIPSAA